MRSVQHVECWFKLTNSKALNVFPKGQRHLEKDRNNVGQGLKSQHAVNVDDSCVITKEKKNFQPHMKHLQINKIFYNVKNLLFFLTATVCHVSPCGSQQRFCMTGRITSFSNTNMTPLQLETAAVLECTWPACAQNRFMPFNAEAKPLVLFLSCLPSRDGCS